jgi:hypothetical protein
MNTLLQQLCDEINARGYSQKTLSTYLSLGEKLSSATIALKLSAIHFLFAYVVYREFTIKVSWPKK